VRSCKRRVSCELVFFLKIYKVQRNSSHISHLQAQIQAQQHFSTSLLSLHLFVSQRKIVFHLPQNKNTDIFKMVQLKYLTFIILAAAGIVSALPSPAAETKGTLAGPADDLPHGIYTVDLADDGSTTWTFIAPINETLKTTTVAARDLQGLDKRDGVSCNGFGTPADECVLPPPLPPSCTFLRY